MMYLGIDAGGTTGVAIINDKGDVLAWMDLTSDAIEQSTTLRALANDPETSVCIEYPATIRTGRNQKAMHDAVDALKRLFPHAATVQPGVWKTSSVIKQPVPAGWHISQHQKDAVGIARWHRQQMLKQQEKNDGRQ